MSKKIITLIIIFILVLASFYIYNTFFSLKGKAIIEAKEVVKLSIKSPSTAEFNIDRYEEKENELFIMGSVDSQNSYGAVGRTYFRVILYKDNLITKRLIINNEIVYEDDLNDILDF